MNRTVIAMMLSMVPALSLAGSVTLSWTPPTENEDGSPLVDLAGYAIYFGTTQGDYTSRISISNAAATDYVVSGLQPGTYYFVATAINEAGTESKYSKVVAKTILAPGPVPIPAPPDSLTVADQVVFTVVKQENRFVLLPVGTAAPETPCDPEHTVNGHYAVPRDSVAWSGTIQPLVVVAKCD